MDRPLTRGLSSGELRALVLLILAASLGALGAISLASDTRARRGTRLPTLRSSRCCPYSSSESLAAARRLDDALSIQTKAGIIGGPIAEQAGHSGLFMVLTLNDAHSLRL